VPITKALVNPLVQKNIAAVPEITADPLYEKDLFFTGARFVLVNLFLISCADGET